jgi:hypothetical protein
MMEKRHPLQQKLWGKLVSSLQKSETRSMFNHPIPVLTQNGSRTLNQTQTLKLVQGRVGNTLELIGIGKNFLNGTPAAQQLRDSIKKWDFIKLKTFAQQKKWSLN